MKKTYLFILSVITLFACQKEETTQPSTTNEKKVIFNFVGIPNPGFNYLFKGTVFYVKDVDTIFIQKNTFNYPVNDSCVIKFMAPINTKVVYNFDMFRGTTNISASVDGTNLIDTVRFGLNCQYLKGELNIN